MRGLRKRSPLGNGEKLCYLTLGKTLAPASVQRGMSAVGRGATVNALSDLHPCLYNIP